MNISFGLVMPRDEISVPIARRIVGNVLRDLGVEETCREDIRLALTEACTNVLKHTENGSSGYEVVLDITEGTCSIRVLDSGMGFEHAGGAREIPHDDSESGRGINLMHAVTDELRFASRPESGTVVHLEKQLSCEEKSILQLLP